MIDKDNPVIEFNGFEGCDRCGARAYACAVLNDYELMFCRHHIREHHKKLQETGWTVHFDYAGLAQLVGEEYVRDDDAALVALD